MPLKYVPPNVRTCDYCGARTSIPKGIGDAEMRRRLKAMGWYYRDFLVLCPRCAKGRKSRKGSSVISKMRSIPGIGRLFG